MIIVTVYNEMFSRWVFIGLAVLMVTVLMVIQMTLAKEDNRDATQPFPAVGRPETVPLPARPRVSHRKPRKFVSLR